MNNRVVLDKPVNLPIFVDRWTADLVDAFDIIDNTEDETGKRMTTIQPFQSLQSLQLIAVGTPYKISTGYLVGKILLS